MTSYSLPCTLNLSEERERQRDRDRQTDRQKDRQTERKTDKERERERERERWRDFEFDIIKRDRHRNDTLEMAQYS